jgi:hypothetical protein
LAADSADQARDGSLVGGIDPLLALDFVEGPIRREDRVDSAIDREGREGGILGFEALVSLEEVDRELLSRSTLASP